MTTDEEVSDSQSEDLAIDELNAGDVEHDLTDAHPLEPAEPRLPPTASMLAADEDEAPGSASPDAIAVLVPGPARKWEYQRGRVEETVDCVIEELEGPRGELWYKIEFEDGKEEDVTFDNLIHLRNGTNALEIFHSRELSTSFPHDKSSDPLNRSTTEEDMLFSSGKRVRPTRTKDSDFVSSLTALLSSDEQESSADPSIIKKRRLGKDRVSLLTAGSTRQSSRVSSRLSSRPASRGIQDDEDSESDIPRAKKNRSRARGLLESRARVTRSSHAQHGVVNENEMSMAETSSDERDELANVQAESEDSDIVFAAPKSTKRLNGVRHGITLLKRRQLTKHRRKKSESPSSEVPQPTRRSGRERAAKSMREIDVDEDVFADDANEKTAAPKVISVREVFQPLERDSLFGLVHRQECNVCGAIGTNSSKGVLVYCQGCSTSIHKVCLGYRSGREHLVTKIGHENFVMQCRCCIGVVAKKDSLAPKLDVCQACKKTGTSCAAFSIKKSSKQEEKIRDENGGEDPITEVPNNLINNASNVMFRCKSCQRGFHFPHLPSLSRKKVDGVSNDELQSARLKEYKPKWQCKECRDQLAKVQGLVAWRPLDQAAYVKSDTVDMFREDEKEYLIRWEDTSFFSCTWMDGGWVWGVTTTVMRKAFFQRDEGVNLLPKWTSEEAIPEEFLRMEIVFDVSYTGSFRPRSEAEDKAQISAIDSVLVKFQGLGYDEAVWESPPSPKEVERWSDFVAAYNEYLAGKYFKQPLAGVMKERVDTFRSLNFAKKVELSKQPSAMTGGSMMPYQMEGLNWLLYSFHQKKNVILADEMGLGKTIQIIALIASLVRDSPKCWPFLVVTPNSTCPNWRREIKKWAPSLRVVAYYGAKKARDMAMEYELYPDGVTDLRAHVVITSYEAPVDDHSKAFFRRVKWSGLIVDEGQRLKNDANLLYGALKALKIPFQVLLTGTPLQNNKRELFNLLQFLDSSINAAKLDAKYEELTRQNLPELHDLIRPFFLRRTKLQVLKFLPPMAQVILPVTMSVVQKKLYKSILAKNPDLIRSIFGQGKTMLRPSERGNLNNILMQLRKCLCHPFLYSSAIEETSISDQLLYRNLVDASSKFQLLEIMLPKLRERGHRVLLFSQFLNMLDLIEDFLMGLDLPFQRLDGTIGSLEKQKRIDAFNAPDSTLFAFLLSTRAGGVGINLATADTVIIMDPDFNPHQDIQALSRAHRIGQKNKVLVFQIMTKDSAEEKIVQIGRKKMALDQALIESMGADDDAGVDLESILKHGAEALFNDDDRNDIHYDSASVDKLLDRTQVENTDTDEGKTAESQFSFARVWANDKGDLSGELDERTTASNAPNLSVWDKILKQRELDAAAEAAKNMQTFGRGKRARQNVDYKRASVDLEEEIPTATPGQRVNSSRRKIGRLLDDTEFTAVAESESDDYSEGLGTASANEPLDGSKGAGKQGTTRKKPIRTPKTPKFTKIASTGSKISNRKATTPKTAPSKTLSAPHQNQKPIAKKIAVKKATSTSLRARNVNGKRNPAVKRSTQKPPQKLNGRAKNRPSTTPAASSKRKITQKQALVGVPTASKESSAKAAELSLKEPVVSEGEAPVLVTVTQTSKRLRAITSTVIDQQPKSKRSTALPARQRALAQSSQGKPSSSTTSEHSRFMPGTSTILPGDLPGSTITQSNGTGGPSLSGGVVGGYIQQSINTTLAQTPHPNLSIPHFIHPSFHAQNLSLDYPPAQVPAYPTPHGHILTQSHKYVNIPQNNFYPPPQHHPTAYQPIHIQGQDAPLSWPQPAPPPPPQPLLNNSPLTQSCPVCRNVHPRGWCSLKIGGLECCGLCGVAHFGGQSNCPHLASEVQIRLMLDALKMSNEPKDHVEAARTFLRGKLTQKVMKKKTAGDI